MAPRYHVGSFDDDASYILSAKALLAGHGLTGHLTSGEAVVGLYPPGYSALLAPLVWIWPHTFLPLRLFSTACFALIFPLTWILARRKGLSPRLTMAALVVLALGPPFATYGSMVMAEAPFLVVLVLLLLAVERWQESGRLLGRPALATVVAAASLVWLKQAGIGLVIGLVLWLPFCSRPRAWWRAVVVAGGVTLTLVPVLVARASLGVPLAGSRYSEELGSYYQGGLLNRFQNVLPHSAWHILATALPATLVPYLEPLPLDGGWPDLWKIVSWQVTILVVVGAVSWFRRHRDAAVPMVVVYFGECVMWPYVNERRAILALPLLVLWYAIGGARLWAGARYLVGRRPVILRPAAATVALVVAAVVLVPLVAQAPRDYLFGWGQHSSEIQGSRYAAILSALGPRSMVVETDYRSSLALFTGHPTNWDAFIYNSYPVCAFMLPEMTGDGAGYLVVGNLNKPGVIDNPCLASTAPTSTWAVALLHTNRDDGSVYELIGPGTAHPDLADLLAGTVSVQTDAAGSSTMTWELPKPEQLSQLSLGEAAETSGPTEAVDLEVQDRSGSWSSVAHVASGVGDGAAPFLLVRPPRPRSVEAIRVVVTGGVPNQVAAVSDVAALGPS
ncbi:MAG TPA: hypothetical protein VG435_09040 [Acidimicrobiales bacterium]|nr:hypothetical protein [Acidimicrobiales bacterium]